MGWKTVATLFACELRGSPLFGPQTNKDCTALLTFYVQTWDEYHTKTLTLGIISGPVEGILILITVYAFTAIKGGGSFWQQSMLRTVGVPKYEFIPGYIYELPFNEWYMVQGSVVLILNTIQSFVSLIPSVYSTANYFQVSERHQSSPCQGRQVSVRAGRSCSIRHYLDPNSGLPVSQP